MLKDKIQNSTIPRHKLVVESCIIECVANRWDDVVDWRVSTLMRVLDTAALLYWPATEIAGGICSVSQQSELEKVSPQRSMLVNIFMLIGVILSQIGWMEARDLAADSGDLPRSSKVDLDALALAAGLVTRILMIIAYRILCKSRA